MGVSRVCQLRGKGREEQEQTGRLGYCAIWAYDCAIQWNLSIEDTHGAPLAVLYTVEPLYRGHHWAQLAVLYTVEPLY